jgi:hypothetical protein
LLASSAPLINLVQKDVPFNFDENCILAFDHLKALFGTRVLVGISGDNPLEYWMKPPPSPNPHKTPPTIH